MYNPTIVIDKNLPIPSVQSMGLFAKVVRALEVGDSALFPYDPEITEKVLRYKIGAAIKEATRVTPGSRFATRTQVGTGIRVWRVA